MRNNTLTHLESVIFLSLILILFINGKEGRKSEDEICTWGKLFVEIWRIKVLCILCSQGGICKVGNEPYFWDFLYFRFGGVFLLGPDFLFLSSVLKNLSRFACLILMK